MNSTPLRTPSPEGTPALHDRAIDNLRFIRKTMERAGSFTAISGWGIVGAGITAFAAAPIAIAQATPSRWIATWIGAAIVALAVSATTTARKAKRSGEAMASGPARKLWLAFAPPLVVGAVLTVLFVRLQLPQLLPGTWLLLYGTAVLVAGAFSIPIVPFMGLSFMVAGVIALFAPAQLGNWFMVAGFGGLHVAFGLPIARRYGG